VELLHEIRVGFDDVIPRGEEDTHVVDEAARDSRTEGSVGMRVV